MALWGRWRWLGLFTRPFASMCISCSVNTDVTKLNYTNWPSRRWPQMTPFKLCKLVFFSFFSLKQFSTTLGMGLNVLLCLVKENSVTIFTLKHFTQKQTKVVQNFCTTLSCGHRLLYEYMFMLSMLWLSYQVAAVQANQLLHWYTPVFFCSSFAFILVGQTYKPHTEGTRCVEKC